ncbi:MAG: Uma2 family endonuclease [Thermostichus sp. DG02_5_bins_236]
MIHALISPDKTQLPPGTVVRIPGTWHDYCALRDSRGDGSIPRMKYRQGEILLMSPLPRHGREAHLISRMVESLLDSQQRDFEAFTPITMELPEEGGIEPDYCFYIDNLSASLGKDRMDWSVDPPPDLVIEIDVTTYTAAEDYWPYRVPEVWLLKHSGLQIYAWAEVGYQLRSSSRFFPELNLSSLVSTLIQSALEKGSGRALREWRRSLPVDLDVE